MSYRKRESWYTNEQRKERHERKKRVQGKEKKKKKKKKFFFFLKWEMKSLAKLSAGRMKFLEGTYDKRRYIYFFLLSFLLAKATECY